MEVNRILLIIVGISIGVTLWRSIIVCPIKYNRGWVVVSVGILFVTGIALAVVPHLAGIITGILWILFIVIPSSAEKIVQRQVQQLHYKRAIWISRIASLLHPFDGWRLRPRFYQARALETDGKLSEAAQIFEQFTSHPQLAFAANTVLYTMRGQWEEYISWLETHNQNGIKHDPGVLGWYLRAMGEVGTLNKMLDWFAQYRKTLEKDPSSLNISYLILFAFCGQGESVEKILKALLSHYQPDRKKFWIATANFTAGNVNEEQRQFTELLNSEDYRIRNDAEKRLSHPLPHATDILTPASESILQQAQNEMDANLRVYGKSTNKRRFAYGTLVVIAINIIVFVLEVLLGGSTNLETLYQLGAFWSPAIVDGGQLWRLITATFLHYGVLHLALNMYALYVLGSIIEARFGLKWSIFLYAVSGIGSMLLLVVLIQIGLLQQTLAVGASGAILGLLGAIAASDFRIWRNTKSGITQSRLRRIVLIILLQFIVKLVIPQVSLTLHLAGVIIGFAATMLIEGKFIDRQPSLRKL